MAPRDPGLGLARAQAANSHYHKRLPASTPTRPRPPTADASGSQLSMAGVNFSSTIGGPPWPAVPAILGTPSAARRAVARSSHGRMDHPKKELTTQGLTPRLMARSAASPGGLRAGWRRAGHDARSTPRPGSTGPCLWEFRHDRSRSRATPADRLRGRARGRPISPTTTSSSAPSSTSSTRAAPRTWSASPTARSRS